MSTGIENREELLPFPVLRRRIFRFTTAADTIFVR